jgi:hypothetical protein
MLLIHEFKVIPENLSWDKSDNSVVKRNVFRHLGFVESCEWPEF